MLLLLSTLCMCATRIYLFITNVSQISTSAQCYNNRKSILCFSRFLFNLVCWIIRRKCFVNKIMSRCIQKRWKYYKITASSLVICNAFERTANAIPIEIMMKCDATVRLHQSCVFLNDWFRRFNQFDHHTSADSYTDERNKIVEKEIWHLKKTHTAVRFTRINLRYLM